MPRRAFSNARPGNGIVLSADNGGLTGVIRSWQFSNSITEADPGAGYWRFNHADPESGAFIYVSATDGQANDMTGLLSAFGVGTKLQIRSANAPGQFIIITITSNDDNSAAGWSTLGYTVVSGEPNFIDDETLVVEVGFVGAQGPQGDQGDPGDVSAASTIADNVLIKGDGGAKGIQETGISVSDANVIAGLAGLRLGADMPANQLSTFYAGTFTPTLTFETPGDLSVDYSLQTGVYWRFNNLVIALVHVNATPTYTTASGDLHIGGLPATVADPMVANTFQHGSNTLYPSGATTLVTRPASGTDYFTCLGLGEGIASALEVADVPSTLSFVARALLIYQAA